MSMEKIIEEAENIAKTHIRKVISDYLSRRLEQDNYLLAYGIDKNNEVTIYVHSDVPDSVMSEFITNLAREMPHVDKIEFEYGYPKYLK